MKEKEIAIAIDGPAAAGKSTVAKIVAQRLTYVYIDTGAMYRGLTLKALHKRISLEDEQQLAALLADTEIDLGLGQEGNGQRVMVDNEDVTRSIRTEEVTNNVSYVAKHPSIRKDMVKRQQILAEKIGVVMDGRDIGTHVLPNARVKIFLIATVEERAKRRYEENIQKGFSADLERLKQEIQQRDLIDSKREAAPLTKAKDAIEIDTTALTIDEVAESILYEAAKVIAE